MKLSFCNNCVNSRRAFTCKPERPIGIFFMLPSGTHYPRIRIRTGPHMLDENPATTGSRTEVWCRLVAACCSQSLGQEIGVPLQALLPTPKLATTARAAAQMLCNPKGPASMSLQVESWHNVERFRVPSIELNAPYLQITPGVSLWLVGQLWGPVNQWQLTTDRWPAPAA